MTPKVMPPGPFFLGELSYLQTRIVSLGGLSKHRDQWYSGVKSETRGASTLCMTLNILIIGLFLIILMDNWRPAPVPIKI